MPPDRIQLPASFSESILRLGRAEAQQWLAALPAVTAALCEQWNLVVDGSPMHGGLSLIVPVRRREGSQDEAQPPRCVLKLVQSEADAAAETLALVTWGGQGAVRLLNADVSRGALLLERLDPQRSARTLSIAEVFPVAGNLLRRLAVPAPPGPPLLRDVALHLAAELPRRWEQLGQPIRREVLERACRVAAELGPQAGAWLIHTDLHDENILARERGSQDEAKPPHWLAIDPKVIAGDPEYGVAPLLWRRIDAMEGSTELRHHLAVICAAGSLDPQRARAWSLVRCVDYWLWGLEVGLSEDPVRCERLATWL